MIIEAADFDPGTILENVDLVRRKPGQRKKGSRAREIIDLVTAFDIETSTIHDRRDPDRIRDEHSFMYIWQWQFGPKYTVIGRYWSEFLTVCQQLKATIRERWECAPLLVVYVHNLQFEAQYLLGIYPFTADETFWKDSRKPLYMRMYDCLELRCSFALSNMSLGKFIEQMGGQILKQSGTRFNYNKIRYPWTELTDDEMRYCINDVAGLVDAITIKLRRDGDTLASIPYTSTGYVRRDCRRALAGCRSSLIVPMLPNMAQYQMLVDAFRGGNTHAAALAGNAGKILENVDSWDMASCYPAQQLTKKFPMGPFRFLIGEISREKIDRLIENDYAIVMDVVFFGLRLRDLGEPVPYVNFSKKRVVEYKNPDDVKRYKELFEKEPMGTRIDNGRIIHADYVCMTITEIDLEIITRQYAAEEIKIKRAMVARKDYLPYQYRQVVQKYFTDKTQLKHRAKTDPDIAYLYGKQKNMLNSVYGMSAQKCVMTEINLDLTRAAGNGEEFVMQPLDDLKCQEALQKMPFPYQWGVYTTAYARAALQEGIDAARTQSGSSCVYCDTDSVKTSDPVDFSGINRKREYLAKKMGAAAQDEKGKWHYPGVYEFEGTYRRFVTLGAKRYAYTLSDPKTGECAGKRYRLSGSDHLHITVSGVTKKRRELFNRNGADCTTKRKCPTWDAVELGRIENFKEGMQWTRAGGTAAVYNDLDDYHITVDGRDLHITRNVSIVDTTYKLTLSKDYRELLNPDTVGKIALYLKNGGYLYGQTL